MFLARWNTQKPKSARESEATPSLVPLPAAFYLFGRSQSGEICLSRQQRGLKAKLAPSLNIVLYAKRKSKRASECLLLYLPCVMRKSAARTLPPPLSIPISPSFLLRQIYIAPKVGIHSTLHRCCSYVTRVHDINRIKKISWLGVTMTTHVSRLCALLRKFTLWLLHRPHTDGWLPGCSLFQFAAETSKAGVGCV